MALVSPGTEVTIVDESQYLPSAPASVPLIVLATAENKANGEGSGVATGTTAANASKLYRLTSQRDLTTLFGNPFFYKTTNGTPLQGYELNEYGLLAAYSALGSTNLCYVLRADIDLATLVGRVGRPAGAPPNGTYWLDTSETQWGIFEFDSVTGAFANKQPIIVNDSADLVDGASGAGMPKQYVGNIGDYAVTFRTDEVTNRTQSGKPSEANTHWYKNSQNQWVAIGSKEWRAGWSVVQSSVLVGTVTSVVVSPTLTVTPMIEINGVSVEFTNGDMLDAIVDKINGAKIVNVSALAVDGRIHLYMDVEGSIEIVGEEVILSQLGFIEGTFASVTFKFGTNAQQPAWRESDGESARPTGSVWIKTNAANDGANIVMRQYSSATETYVTYACPMSSNDWMITNVIDSAGGKNIPAGTLYAQHSVEGETFASPIQFFRRSASGAAIFQGGVANPEFAASSVFNVHVSQPGSSELLGPFTVTISAGSDARDFTVSWKGAEIPFTTAEVSVAGTIILTHTEGGVIILDDNGSANSAVTVAGFVSGATSGAKWGPYKTKVFTGVAADANQEAGVIGTGVTFNVSTTGFTPTFTVVSGGADYLDGQIIKLVAGAGGTSSQYYVKVVAPAGVVTDAVWVSGDAIPLYSVLLSNWSVVNFVPNSIAPSVYPAEGTSWYYSTVSQVDIMTNVGGVWKGYKNVAYASNGLPKASGAKSTDSNGVILSANEPENQSSGAALAYGDLWLDTNDLENYPAIYRWQHVGSVDQWVKIDNTDQTSENGIVFADARWAPNGTTDPVFDTMPSTVSMLTSDYVDLDAPDATMYPQGTLLFNTRRSGYNVKQFRTNYFNTADFPDATLPQETSTWVSVSGNKTDGSPYMGRKAQRNMVVKALRAAIDSNTQIREEDTFFNLIATPGYPELQPNMVQLNNDRNQTAYIIGDTPMRLSDDANEIVGWATNQANATGSGEDGLVTRDVYMGLYYPSGIATDPTGSEVAVPSSHMILRTMIYNDTVAYPWFAPAGQRRGIIDNANNIGFINKESGEFVAIKNRAALRDVEYSNYINPISYFTNLGLLNYGNKSSYAAQSALDRTNVARLICYIRWNMQIALRPFVFEFNDAHTRAQVRAVVQSLLADIQTKRGLNDYLVVCDESNNTAARIDRNELWVDVAIEPTKVAEFIYVPIRIMNTGEISGL